MTDPDPGVERDAAESVVQFLRDADGRFVVKFPGRIGTLPYFRPAEYGGFKMKSLVGPEAVVKEGHYSDEEMVDLIADTRTFEVVPAAGTPPDVWGDYAGDANAHVTSWATEAESLVRHAAEAAEDEMVASLLRNVADVLSSVTSWYIDRGADGDAEVDTDE